MILAGWPGYILSRTNHKILEHSESSNPWQRNKVGSTLRCLDQMEVVGMIPNNLHHSVGSEESQGSLQQGTLHNKMDEMKGRTRP